ncbi:MAG: hypothetical protein NTZ05_06255 [Chloroflexi bacterium]|nr:hypothetical protein [Chloroflexota bacterium]
MLMVGKNRFALGVVAGLFWWSAAGAPALAAALHAPAAAGNVTLSITPASQSVSTGGEVSLSIVLAAGDQQVDALSAAVRYPPDLLEVLDADPSRPGVQITEGSTFPTRLENRVTPASGEIAFSAARGPQQTPPSGTFTIAEVKFRAKAPGAAAIRLTNGTEAAFAGAYITLSTADGSVTITGAAGSGGSNPPPATPASTAGPAPAPTSSPVPAPTADSPTATPAAASSPTATPTAATSPAPAPQTSSTLAPHTFPPPLSSHPAISRAPPVSSSSPAAASLDSPVVTGPPAGSVADGMNPVLTWRQPSGTVQHQLQVMPFNSDGPGLNLIINDTEKTPAAQFALQARRAGENNAILLPGMRYVWRVRTAPQAAAAMNDDGSGWSAWASGSFRTP